MSRIPFGISRLDAIIGGGSPQGTVVLATGESGAGAREFAHTSVVMNALAREDPEQFDLYYGELHEEAATPPESHYLSFTAGESYIRRELNYTMDSEIIDAAVPGIQFRDFSAEYFQLSPIPREWYLGETTTVQELGRQNSHEDLLSSLGDYLSAHAGGNLVVIDSMTDLVGAISDEMAWSDIAMLVKGLAKAAHRWGGLIILLVNEASLSATELGVLSESVGGMLRFTWETGGSQRARTLVVEEFRGVLSQIEEENIVRFEVEIHEAGLDVSDVRKIR